MQRDRAHISWTFWKRRGLLWDMEEGCSFVLSDMKTDDPFRVSALNLYRYIAKGILT